jgi:hypothetical protein
MSIYNRTTRDCSVNHLHPELLHAVQNYFKEHKLGDLEAETITCCETISEKKSTGKLVAWLNGKSDTIIYTGMLLTARRLIWVHYGDLSGTLLNTAKLKEIQVEFHTTPFTDEAGLEIVGYIENANARVRGTIGMGADLEAQKFCEEVKRAISKEKPPIKRKLFKWLVG